MRPGGEGEEGEKVRVAEHLPETRLVVLTPLVELAAIGTSLICVVFVLFELHWFVLLQGRYYYLLKVFNPSH